MLLVVGLDNKQPHCMDACASVVACRCTLVKQQAGPHKLARATATHRIGCQPCSVMASQRRRRIHEVTVVEVVAADTQRAGKAKADGMIGRRVIWRRGGTCSFGQAMQTTTTCNALMHEQKIRSGAAISAVDRQKGDIRRNVFAEGMQRTRCTGRCRSQRHLQTHASSVGEAQILLGMHKC